MTFKYRIRSTIDAAEKSYGLFVWIAVLGTVTLLANYALLASLFTSMEILEFSPQIPWAGLIATYIFLVASGSGLCIINALGSVFGMYRYEMMAKRMAFLSLTTIMFGMFCIVLHLGHPERMPIYNAISPNFRSAISWMGLLYTIYMSVVVVELWLLVRPDLTQRAEHADGLIKRVLDVLTLKQLQGTRFDELLDEPKLHRVVGALAFVSGVSALSMLGSVFAHLESRLLWYGPYYPVYFLVSAIFSGYAFLLAITIISYYVKAEKMAPVLKSLVFEMAQVLAVILAIGLLLITCRLSLSLFDPFAKGPAMLLLKGPFKIDFWLFEVGFMSVLPIFILLLAAHRKSLNGVLVGTFMVLIGTFVMRYEFVVAGQIFPNIKTGLPSYWPTLMEVFLIAGVMTTFLLVYTLGETFLSITEKPHYHVH